MISKLVEFPWFEKSL